MSVRINLEIGHEAAIRTKRTVEGFTHDWEVFVRGCDHANIHHYVEKVVFLLHETFPKPRRVIKDPPYTVKESGYAGFVLPIEIYLRNKDEPKKISFNYDLNLQQTGPAMMKVQKEKYVFNSPGEDFKSKLLKGGGIIVNSTSSQDISRDSRPASEEKSQLVSKPKLGGSDFKKHKPKLEEPRNTHSFQDLFGTPITKTSKSMLDSKPISKDKNSNINKSSSNEKEKSKSKHSPHKDKEKEKFREKTDSEKKSKDDKRREEKKEHSKDREDRLKEKKERREKSPKARSPTPTKRPLSPKRPPSPLTKYKEKEEKKVEPIKEKKILEDKDKSEKKAKKEKRDKDKERKESKHKDKDIQKVVEQKENKNATREKDKHKEPSPAPPKIDKKDKVIKEKEIVKEYIKEAKEIDPVDKNGKIKTDKLDEKPKHKHKKKDKDKKDKDKSCEKEKTHKSEKKSDKNLLNSASKSVESNKEIPKETEKVSLFSSPKNNSLNENKINEKSNKPLNILIDEFVDNDSSNSSISSHEDLFNEPPLKVEFKKESIYEPQPPKVELEKPKAKRDKMKKNKDKKADKKDSEKKRKRKSEGSQIEEPVEKIPKEDSNSKDSDAKQIPAPMEMQMENEENYEDYMNILKDLQHKILTLQDNAELQKVVQLIAETGRFEISAQTFDFDLCLLERSTIKQLQNFFESTS